MSLEAGQQIGELLPAGLTCLQRILWLLLKSAVCQLLLYLRAKMAVPGSLVHVVVFLLHTLEPTT